MQVRPATASDQAAITSVIRAAFGDHGEAVLRMVAGLDTGAATRVSLVAVDHGTVVGHVQLSRAWLDARRELVEVLMLSPLSVAPAEQRRGIGSRLLTAALAAAATAAAPAVFLEGDPGYYAARGFSAAAPLGFSPPTIRIPEPAFQVALLAGHQPWMTGRLIYPEAAWANDCAGLRDPLLAELEGQVTPRPSLDDVSWPIRTARLTLRRAIQADAEAVFSYRSLEEVGRWLTHVQIDRETWARRWAERVATTVVVEREGHLIGDTRVVVEDAHAQGEVVERGHGVEAELMWAFDPEWHGHGYATEAVEALVRLSFDELGLRRLVAFCFADNGPSWRVMERVGMRREGRNVESTLQRDGSWRDFFSYALLASEPRSAEHGNVSGDDLVT